jgi:polygalacturonase
MTQRYDPAPGFSRRCVLGAVAALAIPAPALSAAYDPWAKAAATVARIKPPRFPGRTFDIRRFGAKPDGTTLATAAIAEAVAACAAAGGGRVVVPAGSFLTGAIRLRSRVELHLEDGATLLFSTDPGQYPTVRSRINGIDLMNYSPLVYAADEVDVAITGRGTLDGQASERHWWPWKGKWAGGTAIGWREGMADQTQDRARLLEMDAANVPVAERVFGPGHYLRPPLVQFIACRNVLIEGVRLRRSPAWQIHPLLCRNVTIRDVDLRSHGPNNDGCNPESCSDVLIERVTFDCGDDCIAIKSGGSGDGRRQGVPSRDIVIRDCTMVNGHAGICVGSEIAGGAFNIFGERCRMDGEDLWHALRFKNNAAKGGLLEKFHFRDIAVGRVSRSAIAGDFEYGEGAAGPHKPRLRDVFIERLAVQSAPRVAELKGLDGAPIERISISASRFAHVAQPSILRHVQGLRITDVTVNGQSVKSV